jgi:small redox-active disulfide protein 2
MADDKDIMQISLGKFRVGITGLKTAIEELKALQRRDDAEIAQGLLDKLKPRNYIPPVAQDQYRKAFLREYKKALGENVEEECHGLSIKILGSGCTACDRLEQTAMTALSELGLPAEVEHVRDVKEIAALGVLGVPALLINNEVKAVGTVPSKAMLKEWLTQVSQQNNNQGEANAQGKN